MIIVLVIVIPVGVLVSGAAGAAFLGRLLKRDVDSAVGSPGTELEFAL